MFNTTISDFAEKIPANAFMSVDSLNIKGRSIKADMEMIKDLGLRVSA